MNTAIITMFTYGLPLLLVTRDIYGSTYNILIYYLGGKLLATRAEDKCCKLQTHWQLLVFPTSKTNS